MDVLLYAEHSVMRSAHAAGNDLCSAASDALRSARMARISASSRSGPPVRWASATRRSISGWISASSSQRNEGSPDVRTWR